MTRAILSPPDLGGDALADLKDWLTITRDAEDARLTTLLAAAHSVCESFTGTLALVTTLTETREVGRNWARLASRPVLAVTSVAALYSQGAASILPVEDYALEIDADGAARIRLNAAREPLRLEIMLTAGIADSWQGVPDTLRHGIVRLAAHYYRERESGSATSPPASVAALWRPHRCLRLM